MIEILKKKILKEYSMDDENHSAFVEHAILIVLMEYSYKVAVKAINKQLRDGISADTSGNKLIFSGNREDGLCDVLINAPIDYREPGTEVWDEKNRTNQQIRAAKKVMARNIFSILDETIDFYDENLRFIAPYFYMMLLNNISRHGKGFLEEEKNILA